MTSRLRAWASRLKHEVRSLYFAYGDPRTPWFAKVAAALVVGYALSPIDLIPDPIPVLGYLDDLILLPIGIYFALKLIPKQVMVDARLRAAENPDAPLPGGRAAAAVIVVLWVAMVAALLWWAWRLLGAPRL